MATFDFITGESFRLSLETDYAELKSSMEVKAWKAVHVLAGSIIEALLVDYLIASGYQKKTSENLLEISLAKIISICRNKGIISERTEHLSHVIRSYRNLIHPGRVIRLNESVSEKGARIAEVLTEIIIEEIAAKKKQNYGYTAEQIVSKLKNDRTVVGILNHILKETNQSELERLLLDVLPERYLNLTYSEEKTEAETEDVDLMVEANSLKKCYRLAFAIVDNTLKTKAVSRFIKALKEESSETVWRYAFFKMSDLKYVSPENAELVKQHYLSILTHPVTSDLLEASEGIGEFLEEEEAKKFFLDFLNTLVNIKIYETTYSEKELVTSFGNAFNGMKESCKKILEDFMHRLFLRYTKSEDIERNAVINAINAFYKETHAFSDLMEMHLKENDNDEMP